MFKSAIEIIKKIKDIGYDAYIVGGFVRDYCISENNNIHDIDIATNCPIAVLTKNFNVVGDLSKNKNFGVVIIKYNEFNFEVAQFRIESDYLDGRHPSTVKFVDSIVEDLSRRDFTINAMAYDGENIIDPYGGKIDIADKIIKTVGNCRVRFEEDQLRMLRAIRFAVKYNFSLSDDITQYITENSCNIKNISYERIYDELYKMASDKNFYKAILLMEELNVLNVILPEISVLKNYIHNPEHHPEGCIGTKYGTVFDHVVAALKQARYFGPDVKLAVLFHDIGKGVCAANYDENLHPYHNFYGHDAAGVDVMKQIAQRFHMSNYMTDYFIYCIKNHMKVCMFTKMRDSKIVHIISSIHWKKLKLVCWCDDSCRLDKFSKERYNTNMQRAKEVLVKKNSIISSNIVSGKTVMSVCNITPSPLVGKIKDKVNQIAFDKNIKDPQKLRNLIKSVYHSYKQ